MSRLAALFGGGGAIGRIAPRDRAASAAAGFVATALALLATPRLVLQRRRHDGERAQTDYYLTADGARAAERAVEQAPSLGYYVYRTRLVLDLADGRRGGQLRDVQYLQQEYRDAAHGSQIGGIAGRARARLQAVQARQADGQEAS